MRRVIAYIDAYNLYHSLKENNWQKFYWLNIPLLIKNLSKEDDSIKKIYYFTSTALNPSSQKRQSTYIEAMETIALHNLIDFKVIRGRFEPEDIKCNVCNEFAFCKECECLLTFNHEKETDVNISVQMLSDAYEDLFDVALVITADSDQVGTIKTIKKFFFDSKKVGVVFPPGRNSDHLEKVADFILHISQSDLGKNQLPGIISKSDGYQLTCPENWK